MKREKILRVYCGYPECNEIGFYSYFNGKEVIDLRNKYGQGKWRCTRHTKPDSVLSADNKKIVTNLTAGKSKNYPELKDLFWNNGSGFTFGDGYKAYANDFPEGTILRITAEIILPQ